jgi:hypothetical protein
MKILMIICTVLLIGVIGGFVTYQVSSAAIGPGIDGPKCMSEAREVYCNKFGSPVSSKIVMTGGLFSTETEIYFCKVQNREIQIDYNDEDFYHCSLASKYIKYQKR